MEKKKVKRNEKKKYKALALTLAASLLNEGKLSKATYNRILKYKSYDEYEDFYIRANDILRAPDYLDCLRMQDNVGK